IFARKSTAVLSNGDEKQIRPFSRAHSKRASCHSQGVLASWYNWYRFFPSQMVPLIMKSSLSESIVIVSAVYVCNLMASAPASAASFTESRATSRLPLWLADSSAIIKTLLDKSFHLLYKFTLIYLQIS